MRIHWLFFAVIAGGLKFASAIACQPVPEMAYSDPDVLIANTRSIYLAVLESSQLIDVTFRPFENGNQRASFVLQNDGIIGIHSDFDFDHHTDEEFWERSGGRTQVLGNCSIYPKFDVGRVYLVFLDDWRHVKGFETIRGEDEWLAYVRDVVSSTNQ